MGKALDGANALYQLGQKAYKGAVPAVGVGLATQSQDAEAGPVSVVDDVTGAVKRVIEAWHGSPYKFDRFDMSKIGTGEGAQAYGHGLYAADARKTAEEYRDALTAQQRAKDGLLESLGLSDFDQMELLKALRKPPAVRGEYLEPFRAKLGDKFDDVASAADSGALYRLHINADPDTLLDWDKPLSEQPRSVLDALARNDLADGDSLFTTEGAIPLSEASGQDLYDFVSTMHREGVIGGKATSGVRGASEYLNSIGVPGIRYLDGMSRGAGEGSYNYVVFDDALIDIKERGNISPELLGYMGAVSGSVAAYGQLRQQKEGRWSQLKQDALSMASGVSEGINFALESLEMPTKGLHGLASAAGVLYYGGSVEDAVRRGAQVAQQPIDRTAQDIGQYVADKTGNPYLAAGADAITRVMALEP